MGTFQRGHRFRRGVTLVQTTVSSLCMLGFVALGIDVGYMCSLRADMQRSADASALAGASGLGADGATVRQRAEYFAGRNDISKVQVVPEELGIVIGNWNFQTRTFTATPDDGVDGIRPNAVKVTGSKSGMPLKIAPVIGVHETSVTRSAVAVGGSGVCVGIWGIEGITVAGDVTTDSFDSTVGAYDPDNVNQNGDVCSCEDLVTNGGIQIYGDAMYGVGDDFIKNGSSSTITGLISEHECGPPPVDADYAGAAANNNNNQIGKTLHNNNPYHGKKLHLSSDDQLDLPPGTYYFNDVQLSAGASIVISGPTVIYIDGSAKLTGQGIINTTGDPKNLTIYCAGPTLKLSGEHAFYGAIMAPDADLEIFGDATVYGTIIAQSIDAGGNAEIHVDESLVKGLYGISSIDPILVE